MKKSVLWLVIILVFALMVAALTGVFRTAKDNHEDDPKETIETTTNPSESTDSSISKPSETSDVSATEPSVEIITFVVTNDVEGLLYEFSCPKGMTWGEFVDSEYNKNDKCTISIGEDPIDDQIRYYINVRDSIRVGELHTPEDIVYLDDIIQVDLYYYFE